MPGGVVMVVVVTASRAVQLFSTQTQLLTVLLNLFIVEALLINI